MLALHPPVDAPVSRGFAYHGSPFQRGLHRGVDFGAPPGVRVRQPCGRLVYRGPRVMSFRCGGYRVTLLPVIRGRTTAEPLHLGVRRAGDPFGYVDPAPLLQDRPRSVPVAPAPVRPAVRRFRAPPPRAPSRDVEMAPEAAWVALAAAALAGAGGATIRLRGRRRRTVARTACPE